MGNRGETERVPSGTKEIVRARSDDSFRPWRGLGCFGRTNPSDESLGYFRSSLRDWRRAALDSRLANIHHALMSDIVQKLWGFCHTLRHDGVGYGDYIEQLTYLLFLKMADQRGVTVPKNCDWDSLKDKSGTALTDHYADILRKLREGGGLLGDIFAQSVPRFNNPVNLKRLIAMIDEEDWSAMDVDVKGAAFEGLLEKAASEGKKSALVEKPIADAYVSQHVALVRLKDARLDKFLFHSVVSPAHGRKQLLAAAYGQGKPGLNLENIRDVAVGLPPLAEQQEIVRRVEGLFALADQIAARFNKAQAQVDKLTPSLLARAFRGHLVPQNPTDEPAEKLLERIGVRRTLSRAGRGTDSKSQRL